MQVARRKTRVFEFEFEFEFVLVLTWSVFKHVVHPPLISHVQHNWWWIIASGLALVVCNGSLALGTAMSTPFFMSMVSVLSVPLRYDVLTSSADIFVKCGVLGGPHPYKRVRSVYRLGAKKGDYSRCGPCTCV